MCKIESLSDGTRCASDGDSFIYPLANGEWIITISGDNKVIQGANTGINALHVLKGRNFFSKP